VAWAVLFGRSGDVLVTPDASGIVWAAAGLSGAGVLCATLAAARARQVADLLALVGGAAMLLVAGLHLAPEVMAAGGWSRWLLLAGALVGLGLEALFQANADRTARTAVRAAAITALGVLAVHSTLDGAVYGAAFSHDHGTGLIASVGLIFHEAPEGVVACMLALQLVGPARAAAIALACSSLTTPLGWSLAMALDSGQKGFLDAVFAASAGLLLYVGGHLFADGWRSLRRR
jgi:zinc and cadmium transporter